MDAVFGELRALAHSVPSAAAWEALTTLCSGLAYADPARWADEIAPYLDGALERWPDVLRVCSSGDTRALMDGQPLSPLFAICRALNTPSAGRLASPHDPLYHLGEQPGLARIRHLRLAIDAEINGVMWARLLESPYLGAVSALELERASIGADGAARLAAHPMRERLTSLLMLHCPLGKRAARALLASPMSVCDALSLVQCDLGAPGLRAMAHNPTLRPRRLALDVRDLSADGASGRELLGSGPLFDAVESLALVGYNEHVSQRLPLLDLLDRCQPLHHLSLTGIGRWRPDLLRATLHHPHLAALRSLSVYVGDADAMLSVAQLLDAPFLPALRALHLQGWRVSLPQMERLAACEALAGLERLVLMGEHREARPVLLQSPYVGRAVRAGDLHASSVRWWQ